jgi:hypothetical protein
MIIAEERKKENIVEYIIYIRQIQDIIRSTNFDIELLDKFIISEFKTGEKIKIKIRQWYADLIISMKEQNISKEGDLDFVTHLINDLNLLNSQLLEDPAEYKHSELFRWAKPNIDEFRLLTGKKDANDIHVCIDAVYSLLLLRIKKEPISEETMQAMQTFSNLLANLAYKYKRREPDEL